LIIHLATSAATLQPCGNTQQGGRVKMLFTPKSGSDK